MKSFAPLLVFAILLSFASGYYALFIQSDPVASAEDVASISFLKKKFRRENRYVEVIPLNKLYPKVSQRELIQPINIFDGSYSHKKNIYFTSKDCFKNIKGFINFSTFDKAYTWEEFRCGKRKSLPKGFFFKAPYLHPSGLSYVYLLFQATHKAKIKQKQLKMLLPYFHVSELSYLKKSQGSLPGSFNILADMNEDAALHFVNGSESVLTRNFYLIKNNSFFNFFETIYEVYPKSTFETFMMDNHFRISINDSSKPCFYRDEGICWAYNFKKILSLTSKPKLFILLISVILVFVVLWQMLIKLRQQKIEDSRRRLALQVLTHEFRTPVTSLLLTLENITQHMDKFDESVQEDLLRMSSDIYRLQRLSETSRNYLKSEHGNKIVEINKVYIDSINELIESILEPYMSKIELNLLSEDHAMEIDEYWLGIVLKNLVENALVHGATPVKVNLNFVGEKLNISVSDQGECMFDSLNKMTKPFIKGNKSSGTGLGMNIVKNVVEAMGGSLNFSKEPTTFTISLKGAV